MTKTCATDISTATIKVMNVRMSARRFRASRESAAHQSSAVRTETASTKQNSAIISTIVATRAMSRANAPASAISERLIRANFVTAHDIAGIVPTRIRIIADLTARRELSSAAGKNT